MKNETRDYKVSYYRAKDAAGSKYGGVPLVHVRVAAGTASEARLAARAPGRVVVRAALVGPNTEWDRPQRYLIPEFATEQPSKKPGKKPGKKPAKKPAEKPARKPTRKPAAGGAEPAKVPAARPEAGASAPASAIPEIAALEEIEGGIEGAPAAEDAGRHRSYRNFLITVAALYISLNLLIFEVHHRFPWTEKSFWAALLASNLVLGGALFLLDCLIAKDFQER